MAKKYSLLGFERQLDNHILNDKGEPVIDVWHGGHPNIEKFDMSKMGTGEGAQAYSDGLYNAQRKGVAGDYRDTITHRLRSDAATKLGRVTVGGVTIPISARNWERIESSSNRGEMQEALTSKLKFERDNHANKANALDWEKEKERIALYKEEERLALTDPEVYGVFSFEEEMLYQNGPDWKEKIGYEEPDESEFNIQHGGFFITDPVSNDDYYVRIKDNKTFYDDANGNEVVTAYPEGTSHEFMEFDHEASHWLGGMEEELWDATDPELASIGESYQLAYEFATDTLPSGQPLTTETEFKFMSPSDVGPHNNPSGPVPVSTRRMNKEGTVFDELSPAYYAHMKEANEVISERINQKMFDVEVELKEGGLPVWDESYMPLPDFSNMKGGLYRNHLHVNPDELLDWFEPIGAQPEKLQKKIRQYFDSKVGELYSFDGEEVADWKKQILWDEILAMDGQEFFKKSSKNYGGREQFRKDMEAIDMPGVMYQDYTRNSGRGAPTYNFVMYSDDPIEIIERGAATAPMLGAVFGVTSATLASAMAGKKAGFFDPVLDQGIAEQFPMPEEPDNRSGLDKVLEHNGFLTPYVADALQSDTAKQIYAHPISQYIGQQFDNAELIPRGLTSAAEGIYNAVQGMPASDTLSGMWERLLTPLADTAEDAGQATLKATGSPALAAGADIGIRLMEP